MCPSHGLTCIQWAHTLNLNIFFVFDVCDVAMVAAVKDSTLKESDLDYLRQDVHVPFYLIFRLLLTWVRPLEEGSVE